mgnify:CR=1 FL=1
MENSNVNDQNTLFDKGIIAISVVGLLGFWIYILMNYQKLPDIIPTHFNGSGIADGFGKKWTIFISPILATVFFIGLAILTRFPKLFNYPTTITKDNAKIMHTIAKRMIRVLNLIIIIIFFVIEYKTIQIALGVTEDLGRVFIMMILALIFVPIFYFLIQFSKNSK